MADVPPCLLPFFGLKSLWLIWLGLRLDQPLRLGLLDLVGIGCCLLVVRTSPFGWDCWIWLLFVSGSDQPLWLG